MEMELGAEAGGSKQIGEYIAMLRRRKWQILAVSLPIVAIALVIALALPPVYRSTAMIQVREQEVPPDLVRSTIASFADARVQVISQQLMTRAVLLRLVEKFDLYPEMRGWASDVEVAERMRRDIKVTTINADMSDRLSGRRISATIAFTISYDAPQPERAQQVVNELVTLFLNANVEARQQSVIETAAFLAQEAERLAKLMQGIEVKLAEFKRRNAGRLPESSPVNIQLAERTEAELQRVEREISAQQDRKLMLEAQLASTRPTLPAAVVVSPAGAVERSLPADERLRALQAQYASASAVYGADHPDVRRLQRELAALRAEVGPSSRVDRAEQSRRLESELGLLRQRYGDNHPDVQRLQRSIAALEASDGGSQATTRPLAPPPTLDTQQGPENPVYTMLRTQLDAIQREVRQLSSLRDDLRARQRTYDARLLQTPEVEREYRELTRDYGNAQTRYQEIKTKQLQAEGALKLEREHKAERFSLGEPATLPHAPHLPNRPRILLLGLLAALGSGLGSAWLREKFDTSVKGPAELARIVTAPILTSIPYIDTRGELAGRRRRAVAVVSLVLLLASAFFLAVHKYVSPLPVMIDTARGIEHPR